MAKENMPETDENQKVRDEIRKEWGDIEPKLIGMAHKLEDSKLIESKDYVYIRNRISGLANHFDRAQ